MLLSAQTAVRPDVMYCHELRSGVPSSGSSFSPRISASAGALGQLASGAILQPAAALDEAVGQRGFAVIDVRDDREITDVFHERLQVARAAAAICQRRSIYV